MRYIMQAFARLRQHPNLPLIGFLFSAIFWGGLSGFSGLSVAMKLLIPGVELAGEYLSFGRFRTIHTHVVLFGFAVSIIFAGIYHSMPALLRTPMYSRRLGLIHVILYNAVVLAGAVSFALGINQGKEYAEMEWPFDIAFIVMWIVFAVNFFGTIAIRKEKHFYVSIWFYLGFVVTVPIMFAINNLAVPVTLWKSYSLYAGSTDANIQWWYGHNGVAFILTTPFLGLLYYYLPKQIQSPVYSHRFSIIHFWSLIFFYVWAGPHHLLYSPLPEWVQMLGMAFSVMLILPSWLGIFNGFLTLTHAKRRVVYDPIVKFIVIAMSFYLVTTMEGSLLAIKSINARLHYTDWMIAHVHAGGLGWVSGISFAMLYYIVPRLVKKPLYSMELADTHAWLTFLAAFLYAAAIWLSGIGEGTIWSTLSYDRETKQLIPLNWGHLAELLAIFRQVRSIAGAVFMSGYGLLLYNLTRTVFGGERD